MFQLFQLSLTDEVHPDMSVAQRSTVTGHLVIKMPKAEVTLYGHTSRPYDVCRLKSCITEPDKKDPSCNEGTSSGESQILEVCAPNTSLAFDKIIERPCELNIGGRTKSNVARDDSENFVDDANVPPLI